MYQRAPRRKYLAAICRGLLLQRQMARFAALGVWPDYFLALGAAAKLALAHLLDAGTQGHIAFSPHDVLSEPGA
jgi:hypothetical protein